MDADPHQVESALVRNDDGERVPMHCGIRTSSATPASREHS
jgi:hypothetical protein